MIKIPEPIAVVVLSCNKSYCPVDQVKFLDIESDMTGRDIMSFTCPICGETHQSLILG